MAELVQPGGGGSGSGHTLTAETPVGTINGVNTSFTVANTPVFVEMDGTLRVNGYGYTYAGGIITTDPLLPPTQSIISFYNA